MAGRLPPWTWTALRWSPVALVFLNHGYSAVLIRERSMQPTLNPDENRGSNDIVLVDKRSPRPTASDNGSAGYQRGDVVILRSPTDPEKRLVKRVIATAGDSITPIPASLRSRPARFTASTPATPASNASDGLAESVCIPHGHCWVEGDETFHSRDSNTFGAVPVALIEARVKWVLWPLYRFGPVADAPVRSSLAQRLRYAPPLIDPAPTDDATSIGGHWFESAVEEQGIDWQRSKVAFMERAQAEQSSLPPPSRSTPLFQPSGR